MIEAGIVLLVLSLLAAIMLPLASCWMQRGRLTQVLKDMENCQAQVEVFEAEMGFFPETLEEAFGGRNPPSTIRYCRDDFDGNSGHGNEACSFFDEDNPSGQNQHGGIPALGYVLRTFDELAPCIDVRGAWSSCCGGSPNLLTMDDEFPRGHPGNPQGI